MARHGESKHFKRSVVTTSLVVPRKKYTYYFRPLPGRHSSREAVALSGLLRDVMKIAMNAKEARYLIKSGMVKVDGKIVTEEKCAIGFGDAIGIRNDHFLVWLDSNGKITTIKSDLEPDTKRVKVLSKRKFRGGRTVLGLNDGRNLLERQSGVQVGDTIVLDTINNKILRSVPFEQGKEAIVFRGKNAGRNGKIVNIKEGSVLLKKDEDEFSASETSCMVL